FISITYQDADGTIDAVVPVLDQDDMSSGSAAHLATQQSIKAYVDNTTSSLVTFDQLYTAVEDMLTMNTETFISVTYRPDDTIDFVVPVLDEDDMAPNSASHLATQQSIKAYVDAAVGGGGLTTEEIQDLVGAMVSGNTETNITVTYQD